MATNESNLLDISSSDEETLDIFENSDCTSDEEMSENDIYQDAFGFYDSTNSGDSDGDASINYHLSSEQHDVQHFNPTKRKSLSSTRCAKRLHASHNASSRNVK